MTDNPSLPNSSPAPSTPVSRSGRKPTARLKLLAAGSEVMSRSGFDGSSIAEIIELAGVGVGSFYNHFASKEDLAKAIFAERAEAFGAGLEQVALTSSDTAAATCYAFRRLIEEVESDKVWAAFLIQLEPTMQMLDGLLRKHARAAIGFGVRTGRLKVDNVEAGITAIHAVMIATAKAMLDGMLSSDEAHRASIFGLRMFGVPESEAARLSGLSMSELRRELQQQPRTPDA